MSLSSSLVFILSPVLVVILVLGWFIVMARKDKEVRLSLSGLGIKINISTTSVTEKE